MQNDGLELSFPYIHESLLRAEIGVLRARLEDERVKGFNSAEPSLYVDVHYPIAFAKVAEWLYTGEFDVDDEKDLFYASVAARQLNAPKLQNYCMDRIQALEDINHRLFILYAHQIDRDGFGDYPLVDYLKEEVVWDGLTRLYGFSMVRGFPSQITQASQYASRTNWSSA